MTSDLMFWYYILSNPTIEKNNNNNNNRLGILFWPHHSDYMQPWIYFYIKEKYEVLYNFPLRSYA